MNPNNPNFRDEIAVDEYDLELLILATLRYSLGRHSYMPSFIQTFVTDRLDILGSVTLEKIREEVDNFMESIDYDKMLESQDMDMSGWSEFLKTVSIEIGKRIDEEEGLDEV